MKKFTILSALLVFIAVALNAGADTAAADVKRPNIIVVLTDDQGYGDVGYNGSKIKTPNIDALAKNGMVFTDFYVENRCSPTRLAFMTGCYSQRVGHDKVIYRTQKIGINPDEVTVAELMQKAGYATALVGKWHLGEWEPFHPLNHGFDTSLTFLADSKSNSDFSLYRDRKLVDDRKKLRKTDGVFTPQLLQAGKDFIKQNKDKPFFLFYATPTPHTPWLPSEQFAGTSPVGKYGDVVREIDWQVGELIKTLQEQGVADNTLLVFTSDNGPVLREPGPEAGPLRGGKWSDFEGGIRVPTVMHWSGVIKPGSVNNEIAGIIDLLPTFCEIAGVEPPKDRVIDGVSLLPYLRGKDLDAPIREAFVVPGSAIRMGQYKLLMRPMTYQGRSDDKPVPATKGSLFNLSADIGETTDISAENPEIVAKLLARYEKEMENLKANTRPIGRLPEADE